MGDIADYLISNFQDEWEDSGEEDDGEEWGIRKVCKFCGAGDLSWAKYPQGWILINQTTLHPHDCTVKVTWRWGVDGPFLVDSRGKEFDPACGRKFQVQA